MKTTGFIVQKGQVYQIMFKYDPMVIALIKLQLPDYRFDSVNKCWTVPIKYRIEVERFAYANQFRFGLEQEEEKVYDIPALPELEVQIPLKRPLYPFQENGVAYNLEKKRSIIGDKPGLGKTAQSIATVLSAGAFPCLIICPSGLKENWKREWAIWTDKKAIILEDSIKTTFPRYWEHGMADVFIVNYESLKKYFVKTMPKIQKGKRWTVKDVIWKDKYKDLFRSVVVDESHRCKSFVTQQTKLTKGITDGKEYILLCTGTPVVNKPIDLVSQLGIINQLDAFGGYKKFIDRYCDGPNGASNLNELNYMLKTNCFYQRTKEEVLKDLPAKVRQVVYCDIANRKEYIDAERDLMKYLTDYKNADDDQLLRAMRGEVMVKIGVLKNISARGKLQDVFDYVDDVMAAGEKLVLFCHLKEVVATVKARYPDAVTVTGAENAIQKQASVDSFQTNPETKLIICSIKAAGVGLTLTASSRVAFIELSWTAADQEQCEDRCHRIGQKDSVNAIYFLGKNTIDEHIYSIIDRKRNVAAQVTGNEEQVEENVIENLINLFNQKVA